MGWTDTPEDRRRQHLQMIATGNIRDLDRIHERDRRRKINAIIWFLFILSAVFGVVFWNYIPIGYWLIGFALLFLIILIFRYGLHRKIKIPKRGRNNRQSKDWEKLKFLPDWAYRKMKKRRKNIVNGDHYVYKREGNNFYRRKK